MRGGMAPLEEDGELYWRLIEAFRAHGFALAWSRRGGYACVVTPDYVWTRATARDVARWRVVRGDIHEG